MRTIAIVLGDNDFGNTFYPLLETLKRVLKYRELTEHEIKLVLQKNLIGHYLAFQHNFDMLQECDEKKMYEYLSKAKVLFDAEAEQDILNKDHDFGAWYLEVQSGVISGY
jgi:hypothetical protein